MAETQAYDFQDRGIGAFPRTVGTAGTGTTATEYRNGRNRVTVLAMAGTMPAISGAGAAAHGLLIYTFPAGVHRATRVTMSVGVDGAEATINADTPEVGVGSVIATGSVANLTGTTGFDDLSTQATAANSTGTVTVFALDPTEIGMKMNIATGVKAVHLNIADTWAGADTGPVLSGTVTIEWTYEGPA